MLNVVILPKCGHDQFWTDYLLPYARLLRDASRSQVYRGTPASLIPGKGGPNTARAIRSLPGIDRAPLEARDRVCARDRATGNEDKRAAAERREAPGDDILGADDWAAARWQTGKLGFRESLTVDEEPGPLHTPCGLVLARVIGHRIDPQSRQRVTSEGARIVDVEDEESWTPEPYTSSGPMIVSVTSLRRDEEEEPQVVNLAPERSPSPG